MLQAIDLVLGILYTNEKFNNSFVKRQETGSQLITGNSPNFSTFETKNFLTWKKNSHVRKFGFPQQEKIFSQQGIFNIGLHLGKLRRSQHGFYLEAGCKYNACIFYGRRGDLIGSRLSLTAQSDTKAA